MPRPSQAMKSTRSTCFIASRPSVGGVGSSGRFAVRQHGPWCRWCSMSSSKARSVVRTRRATPSGKLHPPRPSIIAGPAGQPRRGVGSRPSGGELVHRSSARAARPWTHGPHWPALWPLIHASRRAVSARPQAVLRHDDDRAAADGRRRAGRSEALVRTAAAASAAVEPAAVVAADEDRRGRAGRPAGGAHSVDDARAERQLDRRRAGDRAGDGGEERARLVDASRTCGTRPAPTGRSGRRAPTVSTLITSVGRPPTPRSKTRGGLAVGLASPPLRRLTSALSSPATKRAGTVAMRDARQSVRRHGRRSSSGVVDGGHRLHRRSGRGRR